MADFLACKLQNRLPLGMSSYGLMIGLGILACFATLYGFGKLKKIDSRFIDFTFYTAIVAILGGFGSAALFQAFYNYLAYPEYGFQFGGITFLGGLLGGIVIFVIIYFVLKKHAHGSIIDLLPIAACCIVIAHAFGRIGCLFGGCCLGEYLGDDPVKGGMYLDGEYGWGYYVPIPLYESIFLFVLYGVLTLLYLKFDFKHVFSVYLFAYGVWRFIIEFFRHDERGAFIGSLSPSQFWSLVMIVASVGLVFLVEYALKKHKQE